MYSIVLVFKEVPVIGAPKKCMTFDGDSPEAFGELRVLKTKLDVDLTTLELQNICTVLRIRILYECQQCTTLSRSSGERKGTGGHLVRTDAQAEVALAIDDAEHLGPGEAIEPNAFEVVEHDARVADADLQLRVGRVAHSMQVDAVKLESLGVLQVPLVGLCGRQTCAPDKSVESV